MAGGGGGRTTVRVRVRDLPLVAGCLRRPPTTVTISPSLTSRSGLKHESPEEAPQAHRLRLGAAAEAEDDPQATADAATPATQMTVRHGRRRADSESAPRAIEGTILVGLDPPPAAKLARSRGGWRATAGQGWTALAPHQTRSPGGDVGSGLKHEAGRATPNDAGRSARTPHGWLKGEIARRQTMPAGCGGGLRIPTWPPERGASPAGIRLADSRVPRWGRQRREVNRTPPPPCGERPGGQAGETAAFTFAPSHRSAPDGRRRVPASDP